MAVCVSPLLTCAALGRNSAQFLLHNQKNNVLVDLLGDPMKAVLPSSQLWLLFFPVWTCRRGLFLSSQQAFYFPCWYSNKMLSHAALFLITSVSLGDNNPE
ncbi:hypothetical protein ILYODFUR_011705 [Ilyodon furcidens]|uniref:Secreted protein n=1 Tax=Ilyodon furcidens TaxID=33524 RepID=A0ABV0U5X0_9TELE